MSGVDGSPSTLCSLRNSTVDLFAQPTPVGSTVLGKLALLVLGLQIGIVGTKGLARRAIHRCASTRLFVVFPPIGTRLVHAGFVGQQNARLQNEDLHSDQQKHRRQGHSHIGKPWLLLERIQNAHIV